MSGPYEIAEPDNGWHFIPRKGDPRRTASILAEAASWYGGRVVPIIDGKVIDGEVVEPGRVLVRYSVAPPA